VIRVVAGVAVRRGRVLVCRRSAARRHAGKWEFPGGKLEPGETAAVALRRELREELGVEATVGEELWRTKHRYRSLEPIELRFLAVSAFDRTPRDDAGHFAAVRWQPIGRLAELDFLEADRVFIAWLDELNESAGRNRARLPGDRSRAARASTSGRSHAARRDR
jgi:8-oxo-dGTP diphosphatase